MSTADTCKIAIQASIYPQTAALVYYAGRLRRKLVTRFNSQSVTATQKGDADYRPVENCEVRSEIRRQCSA